MRLKLNGVKLVLAVAAIACLAFASTASALPTGTRGLTTTIESYGNHVGAADAVMLKVTYQNRTQEDLYLLRWQTALYGIEGNVFDVRRDGQAVEYTGRLYKRGLPQAEDYVRIPAAGSVAADVELSGAYDMSRTGEYTIRYRASVQDALRADGAAKVAGLAGLREIESNVVFVGVERNERAIEAIENLAMIEEAVRPSVPTKYQTPSYVSCSTSRQSSLVTALSNAQSISLKAKNWLASASSPSTDSAYRTWFGAYTSSRYSTVQSHYNNINSAFVNQRFTFYCDCTDSSYAYVFANQPYRVHLCNAFWAAPSLGIDSKAGTSPWWPARRTTPTAHPPARVWRTATRAAPSPTRTATSTSPRPGPEALSTRGAARPRPSPSPSQIHSRDEPVPPPRAPGRLLHLLHPSRRALPAPGMPDRDRSGQPHQPPFHPRQPHGRPALGPALEHASGGMEGDALHRDRQRHRVPLPGPHAQAGRPEPGGLRGDSGRRVRLEHGQPGRCL